MLKERIRSAHLSAPNQLSTPEQDLVGGGSIEADWPVLLHRQGGGLRSHRRRDAKLSQAGL